MNVLTSVKLKDFVHGENVRKTCDPKDVRELADSIKSRGLLQNLVGYKVAKKTAVSAGHTRLEALLLLVKEKATGHDGKVITLESEYPVLLKAKSEALTDSLVENVQRKDLHPWEEAQGFHRLATEHKKSPAEISALSGKSLESVRKRLLLVTALCEMGQEMLERDEIGLTQALTALPVDFQAQFLEHNGATFSPAVVDALVKKNALLVKHAAFKLEAYQKAGGTVREDLFGQVEAYFEHHELAQKLQTEAAEAIRAKLERRWKWARVLTVGHFHPGHDFDRTEDKKEGGAVVHVDPYSGEVKVYEGLKEQSRRGSTPAPKAPVKRGPITKRGVALTKARKTAAMQKALLEHTEAFKTALAFNVLGLLGVPEVRLGFADPFHSRYSDPLVLHPEVKAVFTDSAKTLELRYDVKGKERLECSRFGRNPATLLEKLLELPLEALQTLFVALTATAIGTWVGSERDSPADDGLALAMAAHLRPRVPQSEMDGDWLKTLSKPRLEAVYGEFAGPLGGTFAGTQLRGLLLERLKRSPEYLPEELTFHARAEAGKAAAPAEELEGDGEDETLGGMDDAA